MNKLVFIIVLAGVISLFSTIASAYTMNGSCVYEINDKGKIEVCNASSSGGFGKHTQYAWVTPNKTGYVNVTFEFDIQLSYGKLWRWENGEWNDKTSQVEHIENGGSHYYTWKNVYYTTGELEKYKWVYKVPWNVSGKWNLYFWKGSYQNPNILVELDPWYNNSYQTRLAFNISNPDAIDHPDERIIINFTGVNGTQCANNTITFGNESVNETEQRFGAISNTTDSCMYVFAYNTTANQDGNVTAGYLYFNITGETESIMSKYGEYVIVSDNFDDGTWNNSLWGKGTDPTGVTETGGEVRIVGNLANWGRNFYTNITNLPAVLNMTSNFTYMAEVKGINMSSSNDLGIQLTNNTATEARWHANVFSEWHEDGTGTNYYITHYGVNYHNFAYVLDPEYHWYIFRTNNTGIYYKFFNSTIVEESNTGNFTESSLKLRFINSGLVQVVNEVYIYNDTILLYQNESTISADIYESLYYNYSLNFSATIYEFENNKIEIEFQNITIFNYSNVNITWNGTTYDMINISNSTWQINLTTPFVMANNTVMNFEINYTESGVGFSIGTRTQSVSWGIYISNIGVDDTTILAGDIFIDYVNVTLLNISSATREVVLTFNNTNTTLSLVNSNGTLIEYSTTITTPFISVNNVNFTLNHTLAVSYGGNTSYRQTATPLTIEVYDMVLSNCSGLITDAILNYTVFDEINDTKLTNINFYWTGVISTSTGSSKTYSFIFNNTDTATICIYPVGEDAQLNATLEYDNHNGLEYAKRTHYMDNITVNSNNLRHIPVYLAPTLNVSNILLIVQDQFFQPLSDHIIRIYFWNYSLNEYVESHNVKTDVNGEALTPLIPFTKLYKFVIIYYNNEVREFPAQFISSSTVNLPTAEDIFNFPRAIFAIQHDCGYNNVTKIVLCTWSSSDSRIDSFQLLVMEDKLIGGLTYCDETSTSTSGTLSCDLTGITNSTQSFMWRFYVYRSDSPQQKYLLAGQNVYAGGRSIFVSSGIGLIVMIPIVLVLVFAFGRSITLQLIAVTIALWAGSLIGFIEMTDTLLAGFIALVVIAVHKIRS